MTRLVAELKSDPSYLSEAERVRTFIAQGGGSRATYFNHAKKLGKPKEPPRIFLKSLSPTKPMLLEDTLGRIIRRPR